MSEEEIRLRIDQAQAASVLAGGVADVTRVEQLAGRLPVRLGFPALAALVRCTDFHASWEATTIGHVLDSFRDADPHLTRMVAAQAHLSPDARWTSCGRPQLGRLAAALEAHAATTGSGA